jgi:hypothetical protein
MALAKVGGLDTLFRLFPKILTPPTVYQEVVTEGLRVGAPDAAILDLRYRVSGTGGDLSSGAIASRPCAPWGRRAAEHPTGYRTTGCLASR